MKRQYFGTDGVRGPYGGPVLTDAFAERLGFAAGKFLLAQSPERRRVFLGRDTRASGPALLEAVARGMAAAGMAPVSLDVLPTPAVALAVAQNHAGPGVMITASHNPAEDNGIKFFLPSGLKLSDSEELAIEAILPTAPATAPAVVLPHLDFAADYRAAVGRLFPPGALAGWRIALDTAHGATVGTSPAVLRGFGAAVTLLGGAPDGRNINAGVGSEHPEALVALVCQGGFRLGVAHDGDGDRCVLCDETGALLDGDEILTILALQALRAEKLKARTLVVTEQSNLGVDAAIAMAGGRVCRTPVGDRYVMERMRAEGATLGGESSGHVICADVAASGDGLVAALMVIAVMRETGLPLSELRQQLRKFPQRSSALKVQEKIPLENVPALRDTIVALERELGAEGRVLVRYSGTEPKLRLLVEGPSDSIVDAALARLETAARSGLQVV
ncbi:MAG: Phosphoglucosamine mutase [Verrucomicrobiota bacterium]|jgi:phosphoglucosamine mutase